ncbi:unnamed protein product, partial [Ascophyllum nodosum]
QYGVAVSGGVEIMALTATLGFEEGCTILSYDGANAFNSIYRHRFLPALWKSSLSGPLRIKPVRTGTPKTPVCTRRWRFGSGRVSTGVQQGCNLGPLCYSAGSLKILKEFRANPPVPGSESGFVHRRYHGHSTT